MSQIADLVLLYIPRYPADRALTNGTGELQTTGPLLGILKESSPPGGLKVTTLTEQEIQKRVNQIKKHASEPANAHHLEDRLWREVLEAIAEGQVPSLKEARNLARSALATRKAGFFRWYTDGE